MAVVVDTHALVWYLNASPSLSQSAKAAIATAEGVGEAIVSVATLIDAWYVSQSTGAVSPQEVAQIVRLVTRRRSGFRAVGITTAIAVESNRIGKAVLPDPWDRLIVATARVRHLDLVTRDRAITASGLVPTIWS